LQPHGLIGHEPERALARFHGFVLFSLPFHAIGLFFDAATFARCPAIPGTAING